MASIITSVVVSRGTGRTSFARLGLATVVAAVLANTLFYFIGSLFVSYDAEFPPLANVGGTVLFTVASAIIAVLVYAGVRRLARNPARVFAVISAVVLVLSIVPDLTYIPTAPGSSAGQTAILIVMHVIAAAVIVWMLSTYDHAEAR